MSDNSSQDSSTTLWIGVAVGVTAVAGMISYIVFKVRNVVAYIIHVHVLV